MTLILHLPAFVIISILNGLPLGDNLTLLTCEVLWYPWILCVEHTAPTRCLAKLPSPFLVRTPRLRFNDLSCGEQGEFGLGNRFSLVIYFIHSIVRKRKNKNSMLTHMCGIWQNWYRQSYLQSRNGDTDVENKYVNTKEERGGSGMNWETGIDILPWN